ncbi:MAG: hypothetical protein QM762_08770 [Chryseolinea sp.]
MDVVLTMATVRVTSFKAEAPRIDRKNLADQYGSDVINLDTSRGLLDPLRKLSTVYSALDLTGTIKTIYHYQFQDSTYWLTWARVVDVARSPVPQDQLGRIYYTGDGEPRMTTYASGIAGAGPYPFASFVLGVTAPQTAPTVTPPVGGITEGRAYVYTFRTALNEESGPSPQTVASGNSTGTWSLSNLDTAPPSGGSVTSFAAGSGLVNITVPTSFGLFAGEEVTLSGMSQPVLNGTFTLKSVGPAMIVIAMEGLTATGTGGAWARVAPHNTTGMVRCVYRTTGTDTTYRRSDAMVITSPTDTTFSDSELSTNLAITLGNIEPDLPPKDMHSLVAMPNGSMAGLSGNQLCFSELNKPHSWPTSYRYSFPAIGVALAVCGMGVIVFTDQGVRYASAPTPASVSPDSIGSQPCVAKRGVVTIDGGAIYPSLDGLYLATASAVTKISSQVFRQQEWDLISPGSLIAAFFDGYYFTSYVDASGAKQVLRIKAEQPDAIERIDIAVDALHISRIDRRLYFGYGSDVLVWASDTAGFMTGSWISKLWLYSRPLNMAVAKIDASFDDPTFSSVADDKAYNDAILAEPWRAGGTLGGAPMGTIAVGASRLRSYDAEALPKVIFTVRNAAGDILYTHAVTTSEPFRLPAGYKLPANTYGISGNIPVRGFAVSTSLMELVATGAT